MCILEHGVPCLSILVTIRDEGVSPRAVACDCRPEELLLRLALVVRAGQPSLHLADALAQLPTAFWQ